LQTLKNEKQSLLSGTRLMKSDRWNVMKHHLKRRLQELIEEEQINRDAVRIVELDQQSVGRLSRMDAIQQQAMAKAITQRRLIEKRAIKQALIRIDNNEYGQCIECGEEIVEERLIIKPTVLKCLDCFKNL